MDPCGYCVLWNLIRKSKPGNKQPEAITTKELAVYFKMLISTPTNGISVIQKAEYNVNDKNEAFMKIDGIRRKYNKIYKITKRSRTWM